MERIASVTRVPCATRTSTWRSLETISSGVCLFLRIVILLQLSRAILQGGPLHWGRISFSARLSVSDGVSAVLDEAAEREGLLAGRREAPSGVVPNGEPLLLGAAFSPVDKAP